MSAFTVVWPKVSLSVRHMRTSIWLKIHAHAHQANIEFNSEKRFIESNVRDARTTYVENLVFRYRLGVCVCAYVSTIHVYVVYMLIT